MRKIGVYVGILALLCGWGLTPARAVPLPLHAGRASQTSIVSFSGTSASMVTNPSGPVPARATQDLARYQQTESFAVRDAQHWRVDVHITAPAIDSDDETYVADGGQVVMYSALSHRAFRLSTGPQQPSILLANLVQPRGGLVGTTVPQFIGLMKRYAHIHVRRLGQGRVAGRTADVLRVSPVTWSSSQSCTASGQCTQHQTGYGWAKMWLDHQYGLMLRYREHGIPAGWQQGFQYAVTGVQFGQGPSDTQLAYTPPVPVESAAQQMGTQSGGSVGPGSQFPAPPGFIRVAAPATAAGALQLKRSASESGGIGGQTTSAEGLFRGTSSQGWVYVKERVRAQGLPAALTAGNPQSAGSCRVWTGTFADGLRWLAMMRGQIAVLVAANKLSAAVLVRYAASGICTATIVPQPSPAEVQARALDELEVEIDITRQILGWVIASAPAKDRPTLRAFDRRLHAFDRAVFAIGHPGDPYHSPVFPPANRQPFKSVVGSLRGEVVAARAALAGAEAAVESPAARQTLVTQGKVFDDLMAALNGMV